MEKIIDKIVNRKLEKDGLVAVPISWQKEYVKLASSKIKDGHAIEELVKEYNLLLCDYYENNSVKELKEIGRAAGRE